MILTSSVSGLGLRELTGELLRRVGEVDAAAREAPAPELPTELAEHRVFRPAARRSYSVTRIGDGSFRVSGRRHRAPGGSL